MRGTVSSRVSIGVAIASLALVAAAVGTAVAGPAATTSLSNKDAKKVKKIAKKQAKKQVGKQFPIEGSQITDGAIDGAKLADGAVDTGRLSSTIPAARVTNATDQTVGSAEAVTLAFDTETYDTRNLHSSSANSLLTAPEDGIYLLSAHVIWGADPDGFRRLIFFVNGSGGVPLSEERVAASPTGTTGMTTTVVTRLEAGDNVQLRALQTSAVALDASLAQFTMTWQAPGP